MTPSNGLAANERRLRIAVLNRNFSPTGGGAERYSIALVEQLAERHDIHVFAQNIEHEWPGVAYHKVSHPFRRPRWINQLWYATATWWTTRHGFDIVHSHENTWHGQVQTIHVLPIKHNLFAGRKGFAFGLRWLQVVTSPRLLAYLWLEKMRYMEKPGRILVVTSDTLKNTMARCHPRTLPMLRVVTPGVRNVPGKANQSEKLAARRLLGLPESGRVILFVGNDYEKKGLGTLLEVMSSVPADTYLVVVGNPAHIAAYQSKVKALGLSERAIFLGALNDITVAYKSADCLVHPTLEDTYAMVVLEAMAHGLPVIVSSREYCGISDSLTDDLNALILQNPKDVEALRFKLLKLASDPVLREHVGSNAIEFAKLHEWKGIARHQEAMYFHSLARQ